MLLIIGSMAGSEGSDSGSSAPNQSDTDISASTAASEPETEISYTPVTVDQMIDTLNSNALSASEAYKDQYLEISGKLGTIDSSGKYISVLPDNDFAIIGVTAYIKTENQKETLKTLSTGQYITIRGKCTDVGEVLGYYMDIDDFVQ